MPLTSEPASLLRLLLSGAPASTLRRLLDTHGSAEAACRALAERRVTCMVVRPD